MINTIPNYLLLDLHQNLINYNFKIATINNSNSQAPDPKDGTK